MSWTEVNEYKTWSLTEWNRLGHSILILPRNVVLLSRYVQTFSHEEEIWTFWSLPTKLWQYYFAGVFEICNQSCHSLAKLCISLWDFQMCQSFAKKDSLASIDFGYFFTDIKILNLRKLIQSTLESGIDVGQGINVGPWKICQKE